MKKRTPLLCIDAGHGGKDHGGGSNQYFLEKELNLKISLYQAKRCEQLKIEYDLTRKSDQYLTPHHRAKLVRNSGARYCFSNHVNRGGGKGAEVIHSLYDTTTLPHLIMDELVQVGMKKRRVFTRHLPGQPNRDYYFMHRDTGHVAVQIIEYGFADHPSDTQFLLNHWQPLAEAPLKALCQFLHLSYYPP
ncbi:N-acetylmuramoyl-L-alanine amidase family protein, partial [Rubeoparvulum massiliense]|uniref:N-acetylmuramoyl-L-alanine amidase family protein n=1 Tax=Rubeoparvulum massiliense TaxID=1631346 RepID=UPI00065E72F9